MATGVSRSGGVTQRDGNVALTSPCRSEKKTRGMEAADIHVLRTLTVHRVHSGI